MSSSSKKSCVPGCLFTLLLMGIFVLGVLHLSAPTLITSKVNGMLDENLSSGGELEKAKLNLLTGTFDLKGLTLYQPEGFDEAPMLELGSLRVQVPVRSAIRRDPLIVKKVHLDGLNLRMVTKADTGSNIGQVQSELAPPKDPSSEPATVAQPDAAASSPDSAPMPVWVQHILLENISYSLHDLSREWTLNVEDIRLEVKDLQVSQSSTDDPATLRLDLSLPGERTSSRLILRARTGLLEDPETRGVPPVQVAIGIFGFDLDLIQPFLVPGARTAVRGDGVELTMFLEVHPGATRLDQRLSGRLAVSSDGGFSLYGQNGGTVAEPELPILNLVGDLFGNQLGRVTQLSGNLAEGSLKAGEAAVKTGTQAVAGAGKTVAKLGSGLLKTAKGVVTLDAETAKSGLTDATVGTLNEAANTVTDTADTAAQGVADTARTASGQDDVQKWWDEVDTRVSTFDAAVDAWFNTSPFPPRVITPEAE
jgi:hypothetical protein